MKYILICLSAIALFMGSCTSTTRRNIAVANDKDLHLLDSISGGYISSVIENAVSNHIRTYLGFEQEQRFFDSIFLCDYSESINELFTANEDNFYFTLDAEASKIGTYFKGFPFLDVDVSRYNCDNISCLYRNRVLLYDAKGGILENDKIENRVKLGLKRIEGSFLEKGYLSDSILDVDVIYPKSLFCDFDYFRGATYRCFFDTINISQNDYLSSIADSLVFYCSHYGLSRIVSSVVILYPSR